MDLALHLVWPGAGRWYSVWVGTGGGVPGRGDGVPDQGGGGSDARKLSMVIQGWLGTAYAPLHSRGYRAGEGKAIQAQHKTKY